MKYERLEIEVIEFGNVDFMTSSAHCDFVFYDMSGSYFFNSTRGNCSYIEFFSSTGFNCTKFYFWVGNTSLQGNGTGYCSAF